MRKKKYEEPVPVIKTVEELLERNGDKKDRDSGNNTCGNISTSVVKTQVSSKIVFVCHRCQAETPLPPLGRAFVHGREGELILCEGCRKVFGEDRLTFFREGWK